MRIHDKSSCIHIDEEKVGVYLSEKRICYILCMCISSPGGLLIKTIKHSKADKLFYFYVSCALN